MAGTVFGEQYFEALLRLAREMLPEHIEVIKRAFALTVCMVTAACLVFAVVFLFQVRSFQLDLSAYPVKAIEWLWQNRVGGNLLIDFNRGSYGLWRLYPHFKISLDGRYEEVYPESTVSQVREALSEESPDFEKALADLNPDYILLDAPVAGSYVKKAGSRWYYIYSDESFVLLGKDGTPSTAKDDSLDRDIWVPSF